MTDMITHGIIRRSAEYPPSHPDSPQQLLEYLQKYFQYTCSKKYGFIVKVLKLSHIHSRKISIYNGNIILDCSMEVNYILPEVGQKMKGVVKQCFPQGVIALACDCMKVFIPQIKETPTSIVHFEIVQTRFQKGKYDCIGKLIKTD